MRFGIAITLVAVSLCLPAGAAAARQTAPQTVARIGSTSCTDKTWDILDTFFSKVGPNAGATGEVRPGGLPPYLWIYVRLRDRTVETEANLKSSLANFGLKNAKGVRQGALSAQPDNPGAADALLVFQRGQTAGEGWETTAGLRLEGFGQSCQLPTLSGMVTVTPE